MRNLLLALVVSLVWVSSASAGEISMVSGLYKSEKVKTAAGSTGASTIELGARYAEPFDDTMHWFGQGDLTLRSYSGDGAPDDSTSLELLGGVRMYYPSFSLSVTPFLSVYGGYKAETSVSSWSPVTEVEVSGLYYFGSAGFRFNLATSAFLDIEVEAFESALFATEKTTVAGTPPAGSTETKTTKTELFASTFSPSLAGLKVGVGFRF